MTTHLIPLPDIEGWIVWVGITILLTQTLPHTRQPERHEGVVSHRQGRQSMC